MPMYTTLVSRFPSAASTPGGVPDLVHDLGRLEVPLESQLPGGAERAADGTAGLRADAQRVPLARPAPGRVVHEHGLDEQAVGQATERLSVRLLLASRISRVGRAIEAEGGPEVMAQGGRERRISENDVSRPFQAASSTWRAR